MKVKNPEFEQNMSLEKKIGKEYIKTTISLLEDVNSSGIGRENLEIENAQILKKIEEKVEKIRKLQK